MAGPGENKGQAVNMVKPSNNRTNLLGGNTGRGGSSGLTTALSVFPITADLHVPADWADYNGHMNEAYYLVAAARAADRFLEMICAGQEYVSSGKSYFTVESHIRYLAELVSMDRLTITTQVLLGRGRKLHLFHHLWRGGDVLSATVETLLLHTDLASRRSSQPDAHVETALKKIADAHSDQPAEGSGRYVGASIHRAD